MKYLMKSICSELTNLQISFSLCPYHPSLPAGPPNYIQYLYRADVSSCWSAKTGVSMYRSPWKNIAYEFVLASQVVFLHILSILLRWFLRLDVSGCIAAIFWDVAFRICSKQLIPFFFSSHQAFSPCVLLVFIYPHYSCNSFFGETIC